MSYVLDALKKAERERRRQPEMGLENLEQDDWVKPLEENRQPRSKKSLWFLCLGLGVISAILIVALRPDSSQKEIVTSYSPVEESRSALTSDEGELALLEIPEEIIPDNSVLEVEASASLAELISEFRFEGSLYIEGNPEASRVFIDGQAYFVGDSLKDDVYISDISPDSVSLSNGYEQLIHPLR